MNPVLKVENLQKYYKTKGAVTKAVDNISFEVQRGEYIGCLLYTSILGASGRICHRQHNRGAGACGREDCDVRDYDTCG